MQVFLLQKKMESKKTPIAGYNADKARECKYILVDEAITILS